MEFHQYPKIMDLEKVPEIFAFREISATEKIHGVNWRIGVPSGARGPGDLLFGSRNEALTVESTMMGRYVKFCLDRLPLGSIIAAANKLKGDKILFGELFGPGIQKEIRYRNDGWEFLLFDVMQGEAFLTRDELNAIASDCGLQTVPEIYHGPPSREEFDRLINSKSSVARMRGMVKLETVQEGIVLRPDPPFRNRYGEWVMAKYKHPMWRESVELPTTREPLKKQDEKEKAFVERYVVPVRVGKMVDRLKEKDRYTGTMRDIPELVSCTLEDLQAEEGKGLEGLDLRLLRAIISKKVADIYKTTLDNPMK
jgi:hypothetical protein